MVEYILQRLPKGQRALNSKPSVSPDSRRLENSLMILKQKQMRMVGSSPCRGKEEPWAGEGTVSDCLSGMAIGLESRSPSSKATHYSTDLSISKQAV